MFGGPGPRALPQNAGNAHIKGPGNETYIHPTTGLTIDGSLNLDRVQISVRVNVRAPAAGETDTCSSVLLQRSSGR